MNRSEAKKRRLLLEECEKISGKHGMEVWRGLGYNSPQAYSQAKKANRLNAFNLPLLGTLHEIPMERMATLVWDIFGEPI